MFSFLFDVTEFNIYLYYLTVQHCEWSDWAMWKTCSKTCGGGAQQRTRYITTYPLNGGQTCTGPSTEMQACNDVACDLGNK